MFFSGFVDAAYLAKMCDIRILGSLYLASRTIDNGRKRVHNDTHSATESIHTTSSVATVQLARLYRRCHGKQLKRDWRLRAFALKMVTDFLGLRFDDRKQQGPMLTLPLLGNIENYDPAGADVMTVEARADRLLEIRAVLDKVLQRKALLHGEAATLRWGAYSYSSDSPWSQRQGNIASFGFYSFCRSRHWLVYRAGV